MLLRSCWITIRRLKRTIKCAILVFVAKMRTVVRKEREVSEHLLLYCEMR